MPDTTKIRAGVTAIVVAGCIAGCLGLAACGELNTNAAPPASAQRLPSTALGSPGSNAP